MLTKSYTKTGKSCRVTFKLPAEIEAESASVLGEFNGWDPESNPMKKLKKGGFTATLSLDAGKDYQFRYLLDGKRWENDEQADSWAPNRFGGRNGIVTV